jgi:hypothetical protein
MKSDLQSAVRNPQWIEPLESRIAPAAILVNATTFTYSDIDGDRVTVTTTGGPFVFANGPTGDFGDSFVFTTANALGGQQLIFVDLTLPGFAGADLTFTVVKAGAGDGLAAVGYIKATGVDVGAITVKGDLNEIDAGDANTATPGIELLSVRSMGRYGEVTDSLVPGLKSDIRGALGALRVAEDIKDARIDVTADTDADAKIGSITIGGSLTGGAATASGSISAEGAIGAVRIGRDLIGGAGGVSGRISCSGPMGAVSIGGSLVGGAGSVSGGLSSDGGIVSVSIAGNVVGGTGTSAGRIESGGLASSRLGNVSIGGSLLGGAGTGSGSIASDGAIGLVKIGHDVKGGAGNNSGKIEAGGKITSIAIGGSLLGGDGDQDTGTLHGQIAAAGDIGPVTIGHDVKGGGGDDSARINAGEDLGTVSIGGSLLGGSGQGAGGLSGAGSIGAVKIGHDILGGSASFTALISTDGPLASVTVGGSLVGGTGSDSGSVKSEGNMGAVKIGHDLLGGTGDGSGVLRSTLQMTSVTIGGSLVGASLGTGSADVTGAIIAGGGIGAVRIGHDLVGGSISGAATIERSGFIESAGRIDSVSIGGSFIAGVDASSGGLLRSGTIRAGADIGAITVAGGLIGNVGAQGESLVTISAQGQAGLAANARADVAIGRITIGGRVEFAQIFAGYDRGLTPRNADAQIGAVSVGADWIASSIVAGAVNLGANGLPGGGDDNSRFGDFRDAKIDEPGESATIVSRIGSITIGGQVFGTPASFSDADRFGFVAEQIGSLKIGAKTFALAPGAGNDAIPLGYFSQSFAFTASAHEIGVNFGSTVPAIAPPQRVNASTLAYTDVDGDRVTVSLSRPLLTDVTVANSVFTFDQGTVGGAPVNGGQQLQRIDLRALAAAGVNITVTVVRGAGDGLANIGAILADEDLGTITIPGDLGQIAAGDANAATRGLVALNVRTLGRLGLDTQPEAVAGFVPFVGGDILAGLGALAVRQDFAGASLAISGALGSVTIGGSFIGGSAAASGSIVAQSIGPVKIGHHVQEGTAGSGFIDSGSSITSVAVGGSVIGGVINADGATLGAVRIGHNVLGGLGDFTGRLSGNTGVGNVTIGGSLLGGIGVRSAQVFNSGGNIGAVSIGHNIVGGASNESAKIDSAGKLTSVTIRGSLLGGSGAQDTFTDGNAIVHSGQVFAVGDIGAVSIGHDVQGAGGSFSGTVRAHGDLASAFVGGALVGGEESDTGAILSDADLGSARIAHGVLGGGGIGSGRISSLNTGNVTIGGSLVGSTLSTGLLNGTASLGAVSIGHDVLGGSAGASGYIVGDGRIASVSIGGSLVGGTANLTGGIFPAQLGPVKIGRDLIGGSITGTTGTLTRSGFIEAPLEITSVSIGGSIISGIDDSTVGALLTNASIRAGEDLGVLSVRGSLIGNAAPNGTTPVIISAAGESTPAGDKNLVIASIVIGGRVEHANILAGFGTNLEPASTFAQIGTVSVGRDWIASNLVAGVQNFGADGDPGGAGAAADNVNFGDAADVAFVTAAGNRIASIILRGTVVGTAGGTDHFGFSTGQIGVFRSLNFSAALTPGTDRIELSPLTGDVTLREV